MTRPPYDARWVVVRGLALVLVAALVVVLTPAAAPRAALAAPAPIFIPNVTKALGGADGWTTPVVIQNTGASPTSASVTLYRFSDGALVTAANSPMLGPGQSWIFDLNAYPDVPADGQYSVVVQPQASDVGAVVLEGNATSWMAYQATRSGAANVYLPNVTRRLGGPSGWETPFIVQNLGSSAVTASVLFYSFADGTLVKRIDGVALQPGRAKPFVPSQIDGLQDDSQYAVVVQGPAGAQLYAVVNEHQGVQAMSYEGLLAGAQTIYLPNVTRYLGGTNGWSTPFIVQNLGASPATFSLSFYTFGTGTLAARADNLAVQPGRSYAVDARFVPASLAPGQYSVVINGSAGAQLGAIVNEHQFDAGMAMSYQGIANALPSAYLPYIQKGNGAVRWVSPVIAQNLGAASADVTVTLFDLGGRVALQRVFRSVAPGAAAVLDPQDSTSLANGLYSALVQAPSAVAAVVNHSGTGQGDYAMSYTSIPGPAVSVPVAPPSAIATPAPTPTPAAGGGSTVVLGGITFRLTKTATADVYLEATISTTDSQSVLSVVDADVQQVQTDFARTYLQRPAVYSFATTSSYQLGLSSVFSIATAQIADAANAPALFYAANQSVAMNWQVLQNSKPMTALRHELTHLMVFQVTATNFRNVPAWLNEGTARLEELTVPGRNSIAISDRYGAASMAANNLLYSFADITDQNQWNSRAGLLKTYQYYEAAEAVQFLRDDLSAASVLRIFDTIARGAIFPTAYSTVAGKPFDTFSAAFPARVRALAPSYPGVAAGFDPAALIVFPYGFAPSSSITITVDISGDYKPTVLTRLTDAYGGYGISFSDPPIGSYTITVVGTNGTATTSAVKATSFSVGAPTRSGGASEPAMELLSWPVAASGQR